MSAPAALVPVKRLDLAKTRLAERLTPEGRASVASRLFEHVLDALTGSARLSSVAVITADA
ncbi:MAG: 2-phospho-L-lactate guanylyltransferase, partial [Polyangiaceae bacterium]|nr:2-phospho-L-lactate guanylyltransferase [Polyangiaceae bacterium]